MNTYPNRLVIGLMDFTDPFEDVLDICCTQKVPKKNLIDKMIQQLPQKMAENWFYTWNRMKTLTKSKKRRVPVILYERISELLSIKSF